jgi:hypothetical protein
VVDGSRGEWIVAPCSEKKHPAPIRGELRFVGVTVRIDRRIEDHPRTKRFIRGIPGRDVDFEDELRGHPGVLQLPTVGDQPSSTSGKRNLSTILSQSRFNEAKT